MTQNVLWSRASVCLSVHLSVCPRLYAHTTARNQMYLGGMVEAAPSCTLLGGFAIGAWVALLWQHNANPSHKLASIPRYDNIVRTAGWARSAHAAGR